MISVMIPTAARPSMLRNALQSVAAQTALGHVTHVFVSENGGDRRSEEICAAFPQLPLTYIYRHPVTAAEHGRLLMNDCLAGDYTAILHDDDWWGPQHLEHALALLQSHPEAGAYHSGKFIVPDESSLWNCDNNLFSWFGAGFPAYPSPWILSKLNVLLGLLLGTMIHYSTLVVRTEKLRLASFVYDLNNPYDNDRMLAFALATQGPVLFRPYPEVFVRAHKDRDVCSFASDIADAHMCKTTRWMVENSGKSWLAIGTAFARRVAQCPSSAANALYISARKPWCLPEMARHLQGQALPAELFLLCQKASRGTLAATMKESELNGASVLPNASLSAAEMVKG